MSQTSNTRPHPDLDMLAVGIRQPWIELILQGIKTIELRTMNTRQRGRIYLYASKKTAGAPAAIAAAQKHNLETEQLPRGVILGSVEIHETRPVKKSDATAACVPQAMLGDKYAWELRNPIRFEEPLSVRYLPYGIWFYPWKRRTSGRARG